LLGLDVDVHVIASAADVEPGRLGVVDLAGLTADQHRPGELDRPSGAAARDYVERATVDALDGEGAGIVTMPMNKEAPQLSDPGFVGHTEFIASLCGASKVTMMLTSGELAVTHVSTHCSLREAIDRVRPQRVLDVIELTDATLRRFLDVPRIAVCGLNPHAGEHGLFGDEDAAHIAPAIERARSSGIDASGPHPADTLFLPSVLAGADAVLAMYHDQGLPVLKHLGFGRAVNITLGLPIIRTSVDHGTALELAGTGRADTGSLLAAIDAAMAMIQRSPAIPLSHPYP
jgi:4-hydroxythreonine-4-phosphate dehydrogenase